MTHRELFQRIMHDEPVEHPALCGFLAKSPVGLD